MVGTKPTLQPCALAKSAPQAVPRHRPLDADLRESRAEGPKIAHGINDLHAGAAAAAATAAMGQPTVTCLRACRTQP